jgi:heme exporter protein A
VALTRLLIAKRPLWLLDEPGASLDVQGRAWLLGMVGNHLADGGIVVAAVHEPIGASPNVRVALESASASTPS